MRSSTDAPAESWPGTRSARWAEHRRGVSDAGHLIAFRWRRVGSRRRALSGLLLAVAVTAAVAVLPALHPEAGVSEQSEYVLILVPTMMLGLLALAVVSAVGSGGGRELLPRDQAAIHPLGATTDHLGALVLAPLNVAWLLQAWILLGSVAWGLGPDPVGLLAAQAITLAWLVAATAVAQVVAWWVEVLRRGRRGVVIWRGLLVGLGVGLVLVRLTVDLATLPTRVPTLPLLFAMDDARRGNPGPALLALLVLLALAAIAVALGLWPAHLAARRTPREEVRADTVRHRPRRPPRSDRAALVSLDRASMWRSVPLRRGALVLALGPGLVALAGGLPWTTVIVLPGLVVSGAALLVGVNAWCLDERGLLWRESLPLGARDVFDARAWVLAEGAGVAALVTIALGALRAGTPTAAEAWAVACVWVVVTLQVVATVMTWSLRSPYAVSMRSARATPAPPAVMVGYSARLALSTTLTALVFTAAAMLGPWWVPLAVAPVFLAWSARRLGRARAAWVDPVDRARVVVTVAA